MTSWILTSRGKAREEDEDARRFCPDRSNSFSRPRPPPLSCFALIEKFEADNAEQPQDAVEDSTGEETPQATPQGSPRPNAQKKVAARRRSSATSFLSFFVRDEEVQQVACTS